MTFKLRSEGWVKLSPGRGYGKNCIKWFILGDKKGLCQSCQWNPTTTGLLEERAKCWPKWSAWTLAVMRQTAIMSPDVIHKGKHHVTSMIFLPETHNVNLIMKTYHTSPNGETFLQNIWPIPFKNVHIVENEARLRNSCRFMETEETMLYGPNWENWQKSNIDCLLDNGIVSMLHFLNLIIELLLCKKWLFSGNTQQSTWG